MNTKITVVLCLVVYMTKALPVDDSLENALHKLGLSYNDMYDYNTYILGIETVVEAAQKAATNTIEQTVDVAQEFAGFIRSMGVQENIEAINGIQTLYFQRIEDMRHQAYNQKLDISNCAFNAVHLLNVESRKSINNVTQILTGITNTFGNYSQLTYLEPADKNLEKSYTIRERIYQCPFSFTDFSPFYLCLTTTAVLEDIVLLNQFTASLNDTLQEIVDLVYEYTAAANLFRSENVIAYNVTAAQVYNDELVPCAQEQGLWNQP